MIVLIMLVAALGLSLCYMIWRYFKLLRVDKKLLAALARHDEELAYWRDLVRKNSVQIGCDVPCNTIDLFNHPGYAKVVSERATRSIGDCVAQTLQEYLLPYLMEHVHEMYRYGLGKLRFRIPMIRADFKSLEVVFVDESSNATIPIVDPRIVAKRELEQQQCIEAFKLNELATDLSKMTKIF